MPTFANIDGEEPSTVTFTVAAISLTRNSSAELQEILCLGDPDVASSLGIARVTPAAPASTNAALNVRIVSGPSSLADFPVRVVFPSTAADNPITFTSTHSVQAKNSTIGDLLASVQQNSTVWAVQLTQYSTTVQVSSVGGAVIVRSSAADFAATVSGNVGQASTVWQVQIPSSQSFQMKNSTIGDLLASVQQNSTVWQTQAALRTSSGGALEGSTAMPVNGTLGLNVRQVYPTLLSTTFSTIGNGSTSSTIVSSVAAQRVKVYAYSITSTAQAINTLSFASSLADPIWSVQMQAISSGITGANLAVSPPAWLFATAVAAPLVFKVTGSSGTYHLSFSYFQEP